MNTDWLAELAPEHAPAAPSWWPPAPGWWLLAAAVLALFAAGVVWWRAPRRRLRRSALRELAAIRATQADPRWTARAVQNLLRRYALAAFGAERIARLSGEEWLRFVAARGPGELAGPLGRSLLAANYGAPSAAAGSEERDAWCAAAAVFLRRAERRDRGLPSGGRAGGHRAAGAA